MKLLRNTTASVADKYASDSDVDSNNDDYGNVQEEGDYNDTAYDGGYVDDDNDNDDDGDNDDDDIEDSDGCNTSSHVNQTPLYKDSLQTVASSNIVVMNFSMKHALSSEAISDLLSLLTLHLPVNNHCTKSKYLLKKHLGCSTMDYKLHYYCSHYYGTLNESDESCQNLDCQNTIDSKISFIEVPIRPQLKLLLEHKHFVFCNWAYILIL